MKTPTTFVKIGGSSYVRLPTSYHEWMALKPNEIIYLEDIKIGETKQIIITKGNGSRKKKRSVK